MNLSEIKQILAAGNLRLTKSLGQNFLHDANQLRRIVAAANLVSGERVLEIGPGLGPLTELLLAQGVGVMAIEKDNRLYEFLKHRFSTAPSLELLHADALDYLRQEARDFNDWKLVANLPYSVASPLLVELGLSPGRPKLMVATLQLEVAQRIAAGPGSPDYGVLSLMLQLDYEPQGWFKIPAGCFFPPPSVDSACITLRRRATPLVTIPERARFVRLVKLGFSQRRKMLMKLLKSSWPAEQLTGAFGALGISPQARAETLDLHQFIALTRLLAA